MILFRHYQGCEIIKSMCKQTESFVVFCLSKHPAKLHICTFNVNGQWTIGHVTVECFQDFNSLYMLQPCISFPFSNRNYRTPVKYTVFNLGKYHVFTLNKYIILKQESDMHFAHAVQIGERKIEL